MHPTAIPTSTAVVFITSTSDMASTPISSSPTEVPQADQTYPSLTVTIASVVFSALFITVGALITVFIIYQYYKYGIRN